MIWSCLLLYRNTVVSANYSGVGIQHWSIGTAVNSFMTHKHIDMRLQYMYTQKARLKHRNIVKT